MSELFQQLAGRLAASGIRHVFGVTGSGSSLGLINAMADRDIHYLPVNHEAAASLMAGGACFDYRCRAAALTIKGPGFANLTPGILANHYESRPAISISEAYPASVPNHQMHKRLGHEAMISGFAKAALTMDQQGRAIDHGVLIAEQETPGPVHIDLTPKPQETSSADLTRHLAPSSARDQSALRRITNMIANSSRPVIVLGSWAARQHLGARWLGAGVPVVTTAAAKGTVDESHPLAAGIMTGEVSDYSPESNLLAEADLVVAFGLRNTEVIRPAPFQCPLITIDTIAMDAPDGFSPTEQLVTSSDASTDLIAVLDQLATRSWGEESVGRWRDKTDTWILQDEWQPGPAFQMLATSFGEPPPRLVLDTGFFCTVGETIWRTVQTGDAVGSGVGRFMGVAIPTAIGLSVADRSRSVVCVMGDGGVGPFVSELRLAAAEKLPIVFVHMSDGGYGSVAAFSDGSPSSVAATANRGASWTAVAEGLGLNAAPADSMKTLENLLTAWQPDQGPLFLTFNFDAERYRRIAKELR